MLRVPSAPRSVLINAISLRPAGMAATRAVARSSSENRNIRKPTTKASAAMQKNISRLAPKIVFISFRSPRVIRCPMKPPAMAWTTVFIAVGKVPIPVIILKMAVNRMAPISAPAGTFIR